MEVVSRIGDRVGALGDRLGVAPHTIVIGVAAVAAAAFAGWWALAPPSPPPVEQVLPRVSSVDVPAPEPDTVAPDGVVVVHVGGAVRMPGVHELPVGSRVVDAIAAAQGLAAGADADRLNLAAPVADGQRVWVPAVGEEVPAAVGPRGPAEVAGSPGPVDLNTADAAQLETLPGVGPSIAAAIVAHRDEHGPFRTPEELMEVSGIGPGRFEQLEGLVSV